MRYLIPERLAWHVDESGDMLRVFCLNLPDGQPRVLEGVAALIWAAAVDGEDVVASVAQATGEPRAGIEEQVLAYLDSLVEEDLLERCRQ